MREDCDLPSNYRGRTTVLPPLERARQFAEQGDAEITAGIVVRELSDIPDSERRDLVALAAQKAAEKVIELSDECRFSDAYIESRIKKANLLANSKKEGEDLDKQLKALYRYPRAKF